MKTTKIKDENGKELEGTTFTNLQVDLVTNAITLSGRDTIQRVDGATVEANYVSKQFIVKTQEGFQSEFTDEELKAAQSALSTFTSKIKAILDSKSTIN